ncbi:MAG: glycosyltransferase involved in cell wall biosynthesis [Parvicellaceae bacterium]
MNPLVSIITVVYNGAKHIQDAFDSIARQDYKNIEHIIIDGGSTDGTIDLIKLNEEKVAYWISEKDEGIYDAMNKGLQKATGEIIGILNADDMYYLDTISTIVDVFQKSGADLVYGNLTKCNEIDGQQYERTEQPDLTRIKDTMSIFHPATFVKKLVYDDLGLFDTQYTLSADYEFILRCFLKGKTFEYLDHSLSKFRLIGVSNSSCVSYKEGYAILKRYNLPAQSEMLKLVGKCKRKRLLHGIVKLVPGSKSVIKKRQKRNWE